MIGDPHGQMAGKATLLVRAADEILGTHSIESTYLIAEQRTLNPLAGNRRSATQGGGPFNSGTQRQAPAKRA